MFTKFELVYLAGKRSKVWWPLLGGGKIIPTRRLITQLMCRLPLLAIWTVIVILILYKGLTFTDNLNKNSTTQTEKGDEVKIGGDKFQDETLLMQPASLVGQSSSSVRLLGRQNQMLIRRSSLGYDTSNSNSRNNNLHSILKSQTSSGDTKQSVISKNPIGGAILSTTRKSIGTEYARQGKVFILIIQNEKHQPSRRSPLQSPPFSSSASAHSAASASTLNQNVPTVERSQHTFLSAHMRLLISILDSHRIDYTIDTIKSCLPTALLTDQDNSSKSKQYSMIIIDDFIKYTKLNRWVRDQLDRHCRTNQIGVVTYLTPEQLEQQKLDGAIYHSSKVVRSPSGTLTRSNRATSAKEESLADQFPLTFKLIDQEACRNSSSTSCLVNYQLNERSPILRILKRKPNFVLDEPLISNINQSPWVSMSSNHVTYEPLTWAKFRDPYSKSRDRLIIRKRRHPFSVTTDTLENNQGTVPAANVVPKRVDASGLGKAPELLKESSDADAYKLQQGQHKDDIVPQDDEENQLQPASDQRSTADNSSLLSHEASSSSLPPDYHLSGDDIERQVLSMFDNGLYDGIKRVIFGGANHHWLNRILLLDSIEHLSSGRIISPLDRYIQIDIDDIFVGELGKRMNQSDVDTLVEAQAQFSQQIEGGFKFNLGFSGKYFKHGQEEENSGDEQLISRAKEFTWFCHTWSHSKAHLANSTESIVSELMKNLEFAQEHKLPIIGQHDYEFRRDGDKAYRRLAPTYAVAPHHSGVYPVHEQLYDAWRDVLNVQVTSTEEYPRLRPASGRRSFVHKTIKVLPRQTCGLYTHTIYRHKYPGGISRLEDSIRGGELFETILHNPVNIYMTHMSNYAKDRLALSTFSALFEFVQSNTNLQLKFAASSSPATLAGANAAASDSDDQHQQLKLGPSFLADYYFALYPTERQPLWTNPCQDKRHLAIWAPEKHAYCSQAPRLLIVGPQKTGTTALYTYLKINPLFKSSQMSQADFEEVQFFNDKHYFNGVDWYFSRFNHNGQTEAVNSVKQLSHEQELVYFDKSATYFDDPKVPKRASHLLPEARIIMLLVNPADRAYSWYQHIKAHGDATANSMSFEQIIMSKDDDPSLSSAVRLLRSRCLHPGYYSQHLSNWLEHYPSRQIVIIDGQWFRYNPGSVMNRLQLLLRVEQPLDYTKILVYDQHKGFYCHRDQISSELKCLGKSKGRNYAPMSQDARLFLNRHYWPHNRQLARLLSDIGQPLPTWLDETVNLISHVSSVIY